ncbi:hypothetical protein C7999DRAFT_31014 [Corynascus novoguineensis]|uniref:Uncharacterized protein n=1 Tax=Corynascus novoguineensis TaxID=1126955 RepID=A0AAN7HK28_9PEZI|nr:hypothetical protein C7999DRAFT_31014 [Corynascus novoguineensis]
MYNSPSTLAAAPNPATETIIIHGLSVYNQPRGLPAQSRAWAVQPLSHKAGGHHIISAHLVALKGGYDLSAVQEWAKSGDCFAKLDWTFPDCNYPKFATRHLLSPNSSSDGGDVSFSGGLGWAEKMLEAIKMLNATNYPDPPPPSLRPHPPPPRSWLSCCSNYPYGYPPSQLSLSLSLPRPALVTRHLYEKREPGCYHFRELEDDQVSNHSTATSLTTASDVSTAAFSEPAELPCYDSFRGEEKPSRARCWPGNDEQADNHNDEEGDDERNREEELRRRLEVLRTQRLEAEARYARDGDASGLMAVLAAARQSPDYWDTATGLPRF